MNCQVYVALFPGLKTSMASRLTASQCVALSLDLYFYCKVTITENILRKQEFKTKQFRLVRGATPKEPRNDKTYDVSTTWNNEGRTSR